MMNVLVLGTGCKKCNDLVDNVKQAAVDQGVEVIVEKITDLNQIMTYGCMTTPGLVVDGTLVSQGKLLKPAQIAVFFSAK